MVIGRDSVLHPLNIAEAQVRTRTSRLTTACVRDDRRRIDVSQTGKLRPLVPDVGDVHQQVRRKLALNSKIELLNIRTPLVWALTAPVDERRESIRIQQALRITVDQTEQRGRRNRR